MAEGAIGTDIGDISVSIVSDDEQAMAAIERLAAAVDALEKKGHKIKLQVEGPDQQKITATQESIEKASTTIRGKLKGIEVPISLTLAKGTIEAIKQQIRLAFENFEVPIGAIAGDLKTAAAPTAAKGAVTTKAVTPTASVEAGASIDVPDSRVVNRIVRLLKTPAMRQSIRDTIKGLETSLPEAETPKEKKTAERNLKRLHELDTAITTGAVSSMSLTRFRQLSPSTVTKVESSLQARTAAADEYVAGRKTRTSDRQLVMELVPEPEAAPAKKGQRQRQTLTGAALTIAEARDAEIRRLGAVQSGLVGRAATGPNKFSNYEPEGGTEGETGPIGEIRTGAAGRYRRAAAARIGREIKRAEDVLSGRIPLPTIDELKYATAAGNEREPIENPVKRGEFDPRGRYPQDPFLRSLAVAYENGLFGTGEEPFLREYNPETKGAGRIIGRLTSDSTLRKFMVREGVASSARGAANVRRPFIDNRGRNTIITTPRQFAEAYLAEHGEINPDSPDYKKFETILKGGTRRVEAAPGGGADRSRPRELRPQGPGFVGVSQGGLAVATRSSRDNPEENQRNQRRLERDRLIEALYYLNPEERKAVAGMTDMEEKKKYILARTPEGQDVAREAMLRLQNPKRYGSSKYTTGYESLDAILAQVIGPTPGTLTGLRQENIPEAPRTVSKVTSAKLRQAEEDFRKQYEDLGHIEEKTGRFIPTGQLPDAFREGLSLIRQTVRNRQGIIVQGNTGPRLIGGIDRAARDVGAVERTNLTRVERGTLSPEQKELSGINTKIRELIGNAPEITGRSPLSNPIPADEKGGFRYQVDEFGRPVQNYITQIEKGKSATLASGVTLSPAEVERELGARAGSGRPIGPRAAIVEPRTYGKLGLAEGYMQNDEVAQLFAKRQALLDKGVSVGDTAPLIPLGSKILGGEEYSQKVLAKAGLAPMPRSTLEGQDLGAQISADVARLRERDFAGGSRAQQAEVRAAAAETEGRLPENPPGAPPSNPNATVTGGGGPIDVNVVGKFPLLVELKGGVGAVRKMAQEGVPPLSDEDRTAIKAMRAERIARSKKLPIAPAIEGPFEGKSEAQIQAESEIAEARALNPARAFQTAVAVGFQRTIGGGADFERRLRRFQNARVVQSKAELAVEKLTTGAGGVVPTYLQYRALRTQSQTDQEKFLELAGQRLEYTKDGRTVPESLEKKVSAAFSRARASREALKTSSERLDEVLGKRDQAQEFAEGRAQAASARRQELITPGTVIRGFAALGGGAIIGRALLTTAQGAFDLVSSEIEKAGMKVVDALTGFAVTASRINDQLAQAIRATSGNVPAAIAGQLGPVGIPSSTLQEIQGPLGQRAQAIAATQNLTSISDALRAARYDQSGTGFDRSLFRGTGGILDTGFLGQQGLFENVFNQSPANQGVGYVGQALFDTLTFNPGKVQGDLKQAGTDQANFYKTLNKELDKANSGFKFLTDATTDQKNAMLASAKAIGDPEALKRATELALSGVAIVGKQGQNLTGTQFGVAAQNLAQGLSLPSVAAQVQLDQRAIQAQAADLERQQQHQLQFSIPIAQAEARFANPLLPAGYGIAQGLASASQFGGVNLGLSADQLQSLQQAQGTLDQINQRAAMGRAIMDQFVPQDLQSELETDSNLIDGLNKKMASAQFAQQSAEYANQLRIADRSLTDINQLTGKIGKTSGDNLGIYERENLLLGRQSQQLAFQLQQRQINLQLALAGFQAPGETSEERAARVADAQAQAAISQKQLDIQKQMFGNQVNIVNIENLRQAGDILKSIDLLKSGFKLQIDMSIWEQQKAALEQDVSDVQSQVQTYVNKEEARFQLLDSELTKLESQYGKFVDDVVTDSLNGLNTYLHSLGIYLDSFSQTPTSPTKPAGNNTNPVKSAGGSLFNTMGTTSMIVGEAGTETVAVLRNPRVTPMTGGGGGNITVNINNAQVRQDSDIREIVRQVENALNRRTQLMGLR